MSHEKCCLSSSHAKVCCTEIEEVYIGGKFKTNDTIFERLDRIGIKVAYHWTHQIRSLSRMSTKNNVDDNAMNLIASTAVTSTGKWSTRAMDKLFSVETLMKANVMEPDQLGNGIFNASADED